LDQFVKAHLQPAITEKFRSAKFHTEADGGFTVTYQNGRMRIGGSSQATPARVKTPAELETEADRRMAESRLSFLMRFYHSRFQRWPDGIQELNDFVRTNHQQAIPENFNDAEFQPQTNGDLKITYQKGQAQMTVGAGPRPFNALTTWSPQTGRGYFAGLSAPMRDFRSEFRRWPNNMNELKEFVRTNRLQPLPNQFDEAKFHPLPDGSVLIVDQRGQITLK
jgi:hypothetical protein